jgi:hypothetical protein
MKRSEKGTVDRSLSPVRKGDDGEEKERKRRV